jgi:hypothetical protein
MSATGHVRRHPVTTTFCFSALLAGSMATLSVPTAAFGQPPASPEEMAERLSSVWGERDLESYAELLAAGCETVPGSEESGTSMDRTQELQFMGALFEAAQTLDADISIEDQWPLDAGLALLADLTVVALDGNGDGFRLDFTIIIDLIEGTAGLQMAAWRDLDDTPGTFGLAHWNQARIGFTQTATSIEASAWGHVKRRAH